MSTQQIKKKILPILKRQQVLKAGLFGSIVRNQIKKNSDIDVVVKLSNNKSLFDLIELKIELEEILDRKVDLVTYDSLHPLIREIILNEQEIIYEKS